MDEARAIVTLSLVPGIGSTRLRSLVAYFGDAREALRAGPAAWLQVPGIGEGTARNRLLLPQQTEIDAQFRKADAVGARLMAFSDPDFPPALQEIYDAPAFLWVRGTLLPEDAQAIAVIGTRRATEYGRRVTQHFTRGLVERGWTIISGLAYGIDGVAHRAALDAGGRTLAVLGSGVDRIYPSSHTALARDILAHGALISEFPMGAAPDAVNFPKRNRIISGMSRGVLVTEAYVSGGALLTAHMAIDQNREVFAVPAPFDSTAGEGGNRLIQRSFARLVLSPEDITAEFGLPSVPEQTAPPQFELPVALTGDAERLFQHLGQEPIGLDRLCMALELNPSTALVALLELEFQGLVRQLAGKQFVRAYP